VRPAHRIAKAAVLVLAPALLGARAEGPMPRERAPVWNVAAGTPLRVWVQPAASGAAPGTVHAVRLAAAEWNAQGLPVRLRLGSDSASANVRVTWTQRFSEPISGRTTRVDDGRRHLVGADVVLALQHSDGRPLTDEEMRVLALHELGHAIGLDHSADPASVMRPRVRVRSISAGDRARVRQLYSSR
jgi:predicted Zn-dependent protease